MEKEPSGNAFTGFVESVFSELFGLAAEMIGALFKVLPKAIAFILWVLSAFVIIPCTFVSNTLYPKWVEWGETF